MQAWEGSLSATGFDKMVDLSAVVFSGFDSGDADTADTTAFADEDAETGGKAGNDAGTDDDSQAVQQDATTPTVQSESDTVRLPAGDVAGEFTVDEFLDEMAQVDESSAASSGEGPAPPTHSAATTVADSAHPDDETAISSAGPQTDEATVMPPEAERAPMVGDA